MASAFEIERGERYPSVIQLKGKVEIRTPICLAADAKGGATVCDGYMVVRADEASLDENTGKIEAHGAVIVSPHEPAR